MVANIHTKESGNSIPKNWRGKFGYDTRKSEEHYADGWRELVIPVLTEEQRLGDWSFDKNSDKCFYDIVNYSDDEISENQENEAREKVEKYREDGITQIFKTRSKMWRRVHKFPEGVNGLSKPQVAKLERWFEPCYLSLLVGNWRQANNYIDGIIEDRGETGNGTLNETAGMFNTAEWLQTQISNYFGNIYDL